MNGAEGPSTFALSSREEEHNQQGLSRQKWPLIHVGEDRRECELGYLGLLERVVFRPRWLVTVMENKLK